MIFEQYLAIDYGTSYIKGILFKEVLGSVSILRKESLKLVRFQSDEGDEYEYNIVRFIQSFFPEESNFIINLPLDKTFIRDIVVPLDNEKAIKEIIPFEVENLVPFPIEDMVIQGSISHLDKELSRVITFSSHHNDVERSALPFSKGDITLKCISSDSFSLSVPIKALYGKLINENNLAQLDIGGKVSIFNLINKGKLSHSRFFTGGGDRITQKIMNLLKIGIEEAEEIKHSINFSITNPDPVLVENFLKQYNFKRQILDEILLIINDSLKTIAAELLKSIYNIRIPDRPVLIYLSGGGTYFQDIEKVLQEITGFSFRRYDFLESNDELYLNCIAMGYHYRLKNSEKINFISVDFSKKINKNSFRYSLFKPHLILTGVSIFILILLYIFSIYQDKKVLDMNNQLLRERFKVGFGRELSEDDDVMTEAIAEVNKQKKKSEIVRLFLSKESILDIMNDVTNNFPSKEELDFVLEQFAFDGVNGNEVHIYGKVNEFSDLGIIQSSLEKSKMFKNIEIQNKRLIQNVTKLRVSFKIKLELVSGSEQDKKRK
jgi:general secretion pathway protein L